MRSEGEAFLRLLKKHRFDMRAAFWLYSSERDEWVLYLAVPGVDEMGSMKLYKRLQSILAKESSALTLGDLDVIDTNAPLVRSVRKLVRRHKGPGGVSISGNYIDGQFIEKAYVYRLAR
jgi:hypothetical protein